MKLSAAARPLALAALFAAPVLLAGCSGVTYGTGTRTEMQTINDVTSMISFGGGEKAEIDTTPRGGIVVPPPTAKAALPAPVDTTTTASIDPADWPNDPDVAAKKRKADQDSETLPQAGVGAKDPGFRFSKDYWDKQKQAAPPNNNNVPESVLTLQRFQNATIDKKALAQAKSERGGSLDENGNPTRRFLTEPPAEYRTPDASAPVDPEAPPVKKKSFSLSNLWPF